MRERLRLAIYEELYSRVDPAMCLPMSRARARRKADAIIAAIEPEILAIIERP